MCRAQHSNIFAHSTRFIRSICLHFVSFPSDSFRHAGELQHVAKILSRMMYPFRICRPVPNKRPPGGPSIDSEGGPRFWQQMPDLLSCPRGVDALYSFATFQLKSGLYYIASWPTDRIRCLVTGAGIVVMTYAYQVNTVGTFLSSCAIFSAASVHAWECIQ